LVFDPALITTAVLLSLTIVITLLYYGRIRRVSKAYEEAKGVVSDVVISFDKQLQRLGEHVESLIHRVEVQTGKSERLASRLDEQERSIEAHFADVTSKAAKSPGIEVVKTDLQSLKTQLQDLVKAQEELKERAMVVSEAQIETAIPIRRERALAPLTETELRVLEFIATSDEKTAPEIKDMIKLTREHTARLMKKLYENGYLERRSDKTPFAYRVKEEMLEILKKKEVKAS
jgi:chaperonin cofactor prefoldin/DNA-binding CsgD family transcriptional regulator